MIISSLILALGGMLLGSAGPAEAAKRSPSKVMGELRDDQALVYYVREADSRGGARSMFVYLDQELLGVIDNNSYSFSYVDPGEYILWTNWTSINKYLVLEAGQVYYFNTTFDGINELDATLGEALLERSRAHVTPTDKERRTAERHITERWGKAERLALESPEGEFVGRRGKREKHVAKWPKVDLSDYSVLLVEDFRMTDPKAKKRKKGLMVETVPKRLADDVASYVGQHA
ncbi:MAG: DUF2846 domain-containing protein, partial [Acidobacteriota bacterium]